MIELVLPTIQEEVADLELVKVLEKRTRGGTLEAVPIQPKLNIQKKKKKRSIRKMKVSKYV